MLLIIGCSHTEGNVNVTLNKFNDKRLESKGFNQQMTSFQFLLKNEIDDMLNDVGLYRCKVDKNLTLDVTFESLNKRVEEKKQLHKRMLNYSLDYILYDGDEKHIGSVSAIDSFIIPSNSYAYIISEEDSQIAGINSLVKQLEYDIIHLLQNKCR